MNWLLSFRDHNFDLKHTLYSIFTSRAYQMPAVIQDSERD